MREKLALWQAVVTPLVAVGVFFGLLEGVLALVGVEPVLRSEDPFVGFVSNVPLFVDATDADGRQILTTAENKLVFFNRQQFSREKAPGTYRIFCLGGSTTYGRPYDDTTSFAGWLRERLAGYKVPRSIDFEDALPRHPTGKLYTRLLRDRYWRGREKKI